MRARWEALHAGLVRSVRVPQADHAFQQAKQQHPVLARFDNLEAILDYLANGGNKDRLLGTLATLVQQREHHELASALLWLGLWPGLDAVYRRRLRYFTGEPEELVAELASAFTEQVESLNLDTVRRVAATLVRSTERDVTERRKRWCVERGLEGEPHTPLLNLQGEIIGASWFDKASLRRWFEVDSALGLTAGLSFEEDVAVLLAWLEPVVSEDAELVLTVIVLEQTQREVSTRLGISHRAACKRFQRAVARVRNHLKKSLSHFGRETRF